MSVLDKPYFTDEAAAYAKLESILWPDGPVCPKCGVVGESYELKGKRARIGLRRCGACKADFTVKVGTVFESSHIPLHKWFQAAYLMASSKKGVSSHQLHRTLDITYKSAWFMSHRLREAMRVLHVEPMGGAGHMVQVDETYIGPRAKFIKKTESHKRKGPNAKEKIVSLIDDNGFVRSHHVQHVSSWTLKPILTKEIDAASVLSTDEGGWYNLIGPHFAEHIRVNHTMKEYVRGDATVNACENYFSVLKRGLNGVYQHVSPKHLKRYVGEFDFRYNNRVKLGVGDQERTERVLRGIVGKRLTYGGSTRS
jgi:transposase-like protein